MPEDKNALELLRGRLEELESSKTDIAKSCGMTGQQLRHIESGRRSPTLAQAFAIEERFPEIAAKSWV